MKIEQRRLCSASGWRTCGSTVSAGQPHLALVFGPRQLIEDPVLINRVRETYPRTPVVCASGAGEFTANEISDDSLVVTAITFERSTVQAIALTVSDRAASYRAGRELAQRLLAPDLVHVFVLSDGLRVNGSQLVAGFNAALPASVAVTGGLAGDGTAFGRTVVGLDANLGPDRVVAIGFYGAHLRVGHGCRGGWVPYGDECTVTNAEDNMLLELDGQPALKLYREHLGAAASGLPGVALRYPLYMTPENGGASVVRTSHSIDEETGIMEFAGDVPPRARVRFLRASPDDLVAGAVSAAQQARTAGEPELVLCVNCLARRLVLETHASEEMLRVRDAFARGVPLAGFYSYGEIAPSAELPGAQFHNQTMTITTLFEV